MVECVVAGGADYPVTGDKLHLPPIGEYRGFRFVAPAVFLAALRLGVWLFSHARSAMVILSDNQSNFR